MHNDPPRANPVAKRCNPLLTNKPDGSQVLESKGAKNLITF
jgi:hypothetical protein